MIEQGTREWQLQRCGMITASCFADCKNPDSKTAKRYMADLIGEMLTGEPADDLDTPDMKHGKRYEQAARDAYAARTGNVVEQTGLLYSDEPWIAGSPDGLIGDEGVLEIKCPRKSGIHMLTVLAGVMPDEHKWQVQGHLWLPRKAFPQRKWADFVSYDPRVGPECELFIVRVKRDEVFIKELASVVTLFRDRMLAEIQKLSKEKS